MNPRIPEDQCLSRASHSAALAPLHSDPEARTGEHSGGSANANRSDHPRVRSSAMTLLDVAPPTGSTMSFDDMQRARALRRMKLVATSLLVIAAIVFVIAKVNEDSGAWVGYVRAVAEAAMVGALADWFAVTALFRHPLRLPIPHTAIIPKRKDQIGRSLGDFVESNFLTAEVLDERLHGAEIGRRAGEWLADPTHAERGRIK